MVTEVAASVDPEQSWLDHSYAALEEAIEQPLDLWARADGSLWRLVGQSSADGSVDIDSPLAEAPHLKLIELLEEAADTGRPCAKDLDGTRNLLAVPLDGGSKKATNVAVTTVQSGNIQFLVGMAAISQRFYQQQGQLIRLREENDFFLKQISDDFEELTFLRAMAERLNLGDGTHDIGKLIRDSMNRLGDAVHAEALYFIEESDNATHPTIVRWHARNADPPQLDDLMLMHLVEEFGGAACRQPVIKNQFHRSHDAAAFPGVRELMLVSVAASMGRIGWYVAINRYFGSAESYRDDPQWRLSQNEFGTSEASLLNTASAMLASHANNLALFRERETLLVSVVRTLVSAIEAKDKYTCGHSERVALYGRCLAAKMGYDEEACERLYLTGLLHDVGKIAVSDAVLNKPGRLTDEEFAEIKRHPDEGWNILCELEQLGYVLPGVLHHHERSDGGGYPDGLVGEDIPIDGRVLAVADAYDAMTSDRAYREGMSQEQAEEILRGGAGTQWDADVIQAFFEIVDQIVALRESYQPRQRPVRKPTQPVATGA
jgi:HD-GYP domain-containing protein (c-di-GMP phosphodiesterase class II)